MLRTITITMFDKVLSNAGNHKIEKIKKTKNEKGPSPLHSMFQNPDS